MTIRLLTDWPYKRASNAGYVTIPAGSIVSVFDAATETGMIAAKVAAASAAAVTWTPPSDAPIYTELLPAEVAATRSLVSADGILPRADTLFAVEKVQMTLTGSPCAAPCYLHRIRCISGATTGDLVVYDNPYGISGTELFRGPLTAGGEAAIATPVRAINGPRGVFTGTCALEYHVSQEV